MVPRVKDILDQVEKMAPERLAEPWDNPGLQVGSFLQEVKRVFLALDPTLKALKSAIERKAQLLLTHHPLIFRPVSRLDVDLYPGDVIVEAVKSGVSVVAAHTNLDSAQGGINDILADLLDLHDVEVLQEKDEAEGQGIGRIGVLSAPKKLSVFVEEVKEIFDLSHVKVMAREDEQIYRIAVIGGSGGGLVALASEKGADLLMTGEIGHHHALEAASLGVALIDAGHFSTEKAAFRFFAERLKDVVKDLRWDVAVEMHENETDPIKII